MGWTCTCDGSCYLFSNCSVCDSAHYNLVCTLCYAMCYTYGGCGKGDSSCGCYGCYSESCSICDMTCYLYSSCNTCDSVQYGTMLVTDGYKMSDERYSMTTTIVEVDGIKYSDNRIIEIPVGGKVLSDGFKMSDQHIYDLEIRPLDILLLGDSDRPTFTITLVRQEQFTFGDIMVGTSSQVWTPTSPRSPGWTIRGTATDGWTKVPKTTDGWTKN